MIFWPGRDKNETYILKQVSTYIYLDTSLTLKNGGKLQGKESD